MSFVCLPFILFVTTPNTVVLSVLIGMDGYWFPISSNIFLMETIFVALRESAPSSDSATDDMTALMIIDKKYAGPLSFRFL